MTLFAEHESVHDAIVATIEMTRAASPTYLAREISEILPIQPGDLVEPTDRELDPRPVKSVAFDQVTGAELLTLDIFGTETERIPASRYRVVSRRGAW